MFENKLLQLLAVAFTLLTPVGQASIIINGTRVIYDAGAKTTPVNITNAGDKPSLAQIWIDKGDNQADPSTLKVPFIVNPPVIRIDPGKGQTVKLFYVDNILPNDKESVFWLNVLDIPPNEHDIPNQLQVAFRTRIKIFYRPTGLQGSAQDAPKKLVWSYKDSKHVNVNNPTPYYVSLDSFTVNGVKGNGGMVWPQSTSELMTTDNINSVGKVHYRAINDYGGVIEGDNTLSH